MRHRVAGVKLSRTTAHRRALFRNLVTALLEHEIIRTTDAKAKETRRWADRMITLGKQGTLHARRRAATVARRKRKRRRRADGLLGAERFAAGWRDGAPPRLAVLAPRAPRKSSVPPKLRACAGAAGSPRQRPVPPSRAGGYLGRTEHVYTFVRSRRCRGT
ncbi:MAG: 50S ribosomal protein L17 [Deltaproteobacteria bacterium]|nr:MAG: 50S ribosomal protein L17 [Deltaproteobacteria bacterium]